MTLITDLKDAGIITEDDAAILFEKFKSKHLNSYQKLDLLYRHFESKVLTRPATGGFHVIVNIDSDQIIDQDESKGYLSLLQLLLDHGIMSNTVHQKLSLHPFKANNHGYFAGLYSALNLTHFYNEFTTEKQLAFAETLAGNDKFGRDGMLDSRKKKKLIRDIHSGKLNTYLDFFEYCHGCKVIDIEPYIEQPKTRLIKNLVKIFNTLIFDAFTIIDITLEEQPFQGNPNYYDTKASIYINTGDQVHTYSYTYQDKDVTVKYNLKELLTNSLTAINQLLANYNCAYRLTGIVDYNIDKKLLQIKHSNYAICLISPESPDIFGLFNAHELHSRFMFNQPMVNFKLPLSYKKIQYALYHYKKSGILSHLSDEQFNQITANIYASNYETLGDLLKTFPDMVISVDRFLSKGEKPYYNFLTALNQLSRGVLNITDIVDETPDNLESEEEITFNVSFKCNGTHHQIECALNISEFDDRIIYYIINEIIRKEYKDHQLLQLIHGDHQKDIYLFANNKQLSYLSKMKLIESFNRFF